MRATLALSGSGVLSSEEIFRALVAHTPVGILVSDAGGKCVYVNERWCELTGLTAVQALGDGWAGALHPEDAERVRREWADASEAGHDSVVECRFLRPAGSVAWVEVSVTALRDEHECIIGWVGACLDLTAGKESELALLQASEQFRVAFENAPAGVALITPDGHWFQVNPALCELLGYSEEELLRLTFADVTHPDDLANSLERRHKQREGAGDASRIEKRYIRADGCVVWVSVSSALVRDAAGGVVYSVAQIEDISARVLAQEAQRVAEERFRRAFEDASIGMAIVALDGSWLRVNRTLCEITGYSEGELLERRFHDITHPDDLEVSTAQVERTLAGEISSYQLEKRYVQRDGGTLWAMLSVSLVRDEAGAPLYFVSQMVDVSAQKRAEGELRLLADHDSLTGLLNRRGFLDQLASELLRSRDHGGHAALLLLDLDNFRYVNDTAGHPVGDRYLVAVGKLLGDALRPGDVLARIGGDEFATVIHDVSSEEAQKVAKRLLEATHGFRFRDGEHVFDLAISVGLCPIYGQSDSLTVMTQADEALYRAKGQGRNRAVLARGEPPTRAELSGANRRLRRIKDAIQARELILALQPIVRLRDNRPVYYEALVRMQGANGEVVPPGQFLPTAELFGLMPIVDRWVVGEVLRELRARRDLRIFVNLDATSLDDDSLLDFIQRGLAESKPEPGQLCFEITERAAIHDIARVQKLAVLRELGCSIALDDFGVGFSSLAELVSLPVDFVKLSEPFTTGWSGDHGRSVAIVRAIVQIAHTLDKHVVAEAVESAEVAEQLRELGVDYAQGFLFGRPSPEYLTAAEPKTAAAS